MLDKIKLVIFRQSHGRPCVAGVVGATGGHDRTGRMLAATTIDAPAIYAVDGNWWSETEADDYDDHGDDGRQRRRD